MSIIIWLYVVVFVVMPLLRLVQVDDVLLAGGLGAHLQHLHLAARHLPADGPVEGGEGDVFDPPGLHHGETLLLSSSLEITQCWFTLILNSVTHLFSP